MTKIVIVAFDRFTDIDVYLMWDLLKRVKDPAWSVRIIAESPTLTSVSGLPLTAHGPLSEIADADVVLVGSGPATRQKIHDLAFLSFFKLDPSKQMIGSMCSGALILAALGLLDGKQATTYPTAKTLLESFGVQVVEKALVVNGNVATAAGCLAAQLLVTWVLDRHIGFQRSQLVVKSIQPVGVGLFYRDAEDLAKADYRLAALSFPLVRSWFR